MTQAEFEKMMGMDDLPHDTCRICGVVFDQKTFIAHGHDHPALCDQCRIDNDLVDIMVADLRQQGR